MPLSLGLESAESHLKKDSVQILGQDSVVPRACLAPDKERRKLRGSEKRCDTRRI